MDKYVVTHVWAYCTYEDTEEGIAVVALYATKQTAEQHCARERRGWVLKMEILTKLRPY